MQNLKESFSWMTPEFTTVDAGKNTIRIKGVAMRRDVVSKNKRKYVDEELKKAARTFIGKPVTINHDSHRIVGDVKWMEYENGAMEYLADIKKEPYVSLLRDKSTKITGVSIEAAYLHNRCAKCGEKFFSEEDFHTHMYESHMIKTDPTTEPHGMLGQALSLVLSPEEPGYEGTSIDLMEMYRKPVLRLLETVITTVKEKNQAMKKVKKVAAVSAVGRQPYDKQLREQDDSMQATPHPTGGGDPCPEGQHRNEEGTCVDDEVPEEHTTEAPAPDTKVVEQEGALQCPEGFQPDESGSICIPKPIPAEQPPVNAPAVSEPPLPHTPADIQEPVIEQAGEADPTQPVPHPTTEAPPTCPEGSHLDVDGKTCVPDEIPEVNITEPPMEPVKVMEIALPAKLRLGEPFADYSDFADCVAKNKGKTDDPEAYCASIKQKAEGDTAKEMYHPQRPYIRDMQIASTLNKLTEAVAKMAREEPERFNKLLVTPFNEFNRKMSEHLNVLRKTISLEAKLRGKGNAETQRIIKEAMKTVVKIGGDVDKLSKFTTTKLTELATAHAGLDKKMDEKTHVFERTLALADKNNIDLKGQLKTLEDRMKEQEEQPAPCPEGQHRNEQGECVPDEDTQQKAEELKETKKLVEKLETKVDNLEDKLKGSFKGRSPAKQDEQGVKFLRDPKREGKKEAK